ncbi:MAG: hypothetical protein KDC66_09445 [Phaeodactylibacter sp.]|nr:hypothetical protein [Phaeodactylibacter sp.]MCB9272980.1 hypothetical protein [Lewinellaceae bacterium]
MQKVLLSLLPAFLIQLCLTAQTPLPIGQWRSHLPYSAGKFVTQSKDKAYYSTDFSLVSIDKADMSAELLDKTKGLSGVGIEFIRYNTFSDILIVVYKDAVIDLIKPDGEIVTMAQIRNFSNFTGEKKVNELYVANDSIVYLAANYGVSMINIFANEFAFTTFTGISVGYVHLFAGYIYASTAEGIYRAPAGGAVNLADFGNWKLLGPEEGFPSDYSPGPVTEYQGALYVGVNDTLFRYENNALDFVHYEFGSTLQFLTAEGRDLLAGFRPGRIVYFRPDGFMGILPGECVQTPNYAIEDEQGRIWIGNDRAGSGFQMLTQDFLGDCITININSPYSEAVWDMAIHEGKLWLASGGLDQTLSARFIPDGFASFMDGQWAVYNRDTREELKGEDLNSNDDDIQVFVAAAVNPANGKAYIGSFIEGLVEVDGDKITQYKETNSTLQRAQGDPRIRVGGLAFDADNNLWVANNSTERPLSVMLPDGSWKSFVMPNCNQNQVFDIAVDGSGYKWMRLGNNSAGLLLFDEGDIDDPNDDRCRVFTSNNSNLPSNNVNCLVADLEGDIWVGTTEGVTIFECGNSAFEDACQGSRRIVEVDGFGAYLLESETVQTIAVDGANRKWVGTKNGVFVLSPNGEEQIARFTEDNSPLFDNDVVDIAINADNGEVFIGTITGLISYQSDAVSGGRVHKSKLTVYPNPVREDYDGPIAIKGLARDANVKITDVNGKLVYETQALGGQAIWDGRDYNGRRVNTGVYLVFSTSNPRYAGFSGKADAAVTKILVVKGE